MAKINICTSCGFTWGEFMSRGRLGCPDCYTVFARELKGILAELHGNVKHTVTKKQKSTKVKDIKKSEQLRHLKGLLKSAVKYEKFEEALRIKREISRLEGSGEKTG